MSENICAKICSILEKFSILEKNLKKIYSIQIKIIFILNIKSLFENLNIYKEREREKKRVRVRER